MLCCIRCGQKDNKNPLGKLKKRYPCLLRKDKTGQDVVTQGLDSKISPNSCTYKPLFLGVVLEHSHLRGTQHPSQKHKVDEPLGAHYLGEHWDWGVLSVIRRASVTQKDYSPTCCGYWFLKNPSLFFILVLQLPIQHCCVSAWCSLSHLHVLLQEQPCRTVLVLHLLHLTSSDVLKTWVLPMEMHK